MAVKKGVQAMAYPDFLSRNKDTLSEEQKQAKELKEKRLRALSQDGMKLDRIPENERDKDLCREALKQNGMALQFIADDQRDMYYCQKALRSQGLALQYVPQELRSDSVCRLACRNNGLALEYVPQELRDVQMCTIALSQTSSALRFVPEALFDEALLRLAMRVDGAALEFVPGDMRSEAICYEAVRTSGLALNFVPEALRTPLIRIRALFSAVAEKRRNTTIVCHTPPDWEEMRKVKPRSEWGRFEKWQIESPEGLAIPEELAPSAAEIKEFMADLVHAYLEAAGKEGCLDNEEALHAGSCFWVDVPAKEVPEGEERTYSVYARGMSLLLKSEELDDHGVPLQSGAFVAATKLMDWSEGWLDDNKSK